MSDVTGQDGTSVVEGDLIGIWRVGEVVCQTSNHRLHRAQSADADGSNRWPYVIRVGTETTRAATGNWLRVAAKVTHPGLIAVVDGSAGAALPFVVMPFVAGEQTTMSLPVALWSARQVAETLATLHDAGLVHGNVHPRHILVGSDGQPMLIDLGIAAPVHSVRPPGPMPDAGFAAPEALAVGYAAIPAMDVFSLGRTLWSWMIEVQRTGIDAADRDWIEAAELIESMVAVDPRDRPTMALVIGRLSQIELRSLQRSLSPVTQPPAAKAA